MGHSVFDVNTSNWWLGHQVLIAPAGLKEVSWVHSKVTTGLTRQEVKNAPAYDSLIALNRVMRRHLPALPAKGLLARQEWTWAA